MLSSSSSSISPCRAPWSPQGACHCIPLPHAARQALQYYSQDMEGLRISHWRILRRLGSGGMDEVYGAEDERLRRDVAIKFISHDKATDERARQRFEREAQAASALNHPNICTIFEINEHEGQPSLVMELLDGQDLRQNWTADPVEISSLSTWTVEITDALAAAHARGSSTATSSQATSLSGRAAMLLWQKDLYQ